MEFRRGELGLDPGPTMYEGEEKTGVDVENGTKEMSHPKTAGRTGREGPYSGSVVEASGDSFDEDFNFKTGHEEVKYLT
jgi:hypothetical protein